MLRHGIARHNIKQFKNHKTNVIPISEGSLIRLLLASLSLNLCTHVLINTLDSMQMICIYLMHIPDLGNQRKDSDPLRLIYNKSLRFRRFCNSEYITDLPKELLFISYRQIK